METLSCLPGWWRSSKKRWEAPAVFHTLGSLLPSCLGGRTEALGLSHGLVVVFPHWTAHGRVLLGISVSIPLAPSSKTSDFSHFPPGFPFTPTALQGRALWRVSPWSSGPSTGSIPSTGRCWAPLGREDNNPHVAHPQQTPKCPTWQFSKAFIRKK